MKLKFLLASFATLILGLSMSSAQIVYKKEKKGDSNNVSISIGKQDSENEDEQEDDGDADSKYPRTYGGITFTRLDWGFSRLSDDGSFTLSEDNKFMSYKKSSNFGFDIAQFGVRFNDNFKMYLSAGFEWNYWRLKNDVLLLQDQSPIAYDDLNPDAKYSKNVITSTYLRVPLSFELRTRQLSGGKRVKLAFGAMTGVLLKGTQRLKSEEFGKQKYKDNYNLQTFQYGPFVRIGYDNFGLFTKYYMNDLFEKSPNQEGLRNLAFGITLGF